MAFSFHGACLTGRKTTRSQAAGWKFKIFFFPFFFFFQPPPSKCTHFTLVLLHSFLGVPFMTVRLQVYSLFSFSTFFPLNFSLPYTRFSLSLPLSLVFYFCTAYRMTGNQFFLNEDNNTKLTYLLNEIFKQERDTSYFFGQINVH